MPEETEDLLLTPDEIQALTTETLPADLLAQLARTATDTVRDYCGWRVAKRTTETLHLRVRGGAAIFLPSLLIHDITAVSIDGQALEPTEFDDWSDSGALYLPTRHRPSARRHRVDVTLDHGYERCPGAIATAIADAAGRGALVPLGGVVAESAIGQSATYARTASGTAARAAFTPDELLTLDAHRIRQSR